MSSSIVISAYNEETVIGRCLDAFLRDAEPDEFDVTVVANGCTDATADVARTRSGVRVVEKEYGLKTDGLNAGDAVAIGYPRIYLDADVEITADGLRALVRALDPALTGSGQAPLAVVPRRALDLSGRPLAVRAFYAINGRLPLYGTALVNHCVTALSERGRRRFVIFPPVIADDLFLDSLFTDAEKRQVDAATVRIATPMRTRGLVNRLARVRRGNAELRRARAAEGARVRGAAPFAWVSQVVLPRPWLAPAGVCYAALILAAEVTSRRHVRRGVRWGRDDSSR